MKIVSEIEYPSCTTHKTVSSVMALDDMVKEITGRYISVEDGAMGVFDALEDVLRETYMIWRAKHVRIEADNIRRKVTKDAHDSKSKYVCEGCGAEVDRIEMHHIKPVSIGGGNERTNVTFVCRKCHREMHKELRKEKQEDRQ